MKLQPVNDSSPFRFALVGTLSVLCYLSALGAEPISGVTVSPQFFNPSVGETVTLTFFVEINGRLDALVVDRDGYVVRALARDLPISKGENSVSWDGRDQSGNNVVPDEAYSFKLDVRTGQSRFSYFPALKQEPIYSVPATYYDRAAGILSYTLKQPARVYAQAGVRKKDTKTGQSTGPVLATIVNGPRSSGPIVEAWNSLLDNGLDISRLPGFAVAIAAQNLPANSAIAVGNRTWRFVDYITFRKGTSLIPKSKQSDLSNRLIAYDGFSPSFKIIPAGSARFAKEEVVFSRSKNLKLTCELTGLGKQNFTKDPADIFVYLDDTLVRKSKPAKSNIFDLNLPARGIAEGQHYVALNWRTPHGQTAIGVLRFTLGDSSRASKN